MDLSKATNTRSLRVHVWVPELIFKRGGIQTFSRCLVEALVEILGTDRVQVMAKNDLRTDYKTARPRDHDKSCGVVVTSRGWGNYPAIVRTPMFFFGIVWSAMRDRPDLVISTHLNFGIAGYVLRLFTGTRYWCVAHGVEAWNLYRYLARLGLSKSDLVVAVSNYTRERLLSEQRLKPQQVVVLPNTIDPEAIKPGPKPDYLMRRHALTVRNKVILTVARMAEPERYKGYDQIVRALPEIRREIPEVRYVLVGEGEDRTRIEALIRELDVCESVVLAGGVAQRELPDYYNLCDVFAMPSKGEGFGIVYLEALICGKPVLAGNSDGSSEPLQNGELGTLVDPNNVEEIGTNLIRILREPGAGRGEQGVRNGQWLREETLRKFGFGAFKARLSSLLYKAAERSRDQGVSRKQPRELESKSLN